MLKSFIAAIASVSLSSCRKAKKYKFASAVRLGHFQSFFNYSSWINKIVHLVLDSRWVSRRCKIGVYITTTTPLTVVVPDTI